MIVDRGSNGRNRRIASLDVESHQDFVRGFRAWTFGPLHAAAAARAAERIAGANNLSIPALRAAFESDPLIATRLRCWISSQQLMWRSLNDHYDRYGETYRADLAKADAAGPGTLTLDPDLVIPDYARHEIHIQPGGYVGDDLAGPVYHHGTDSFLAGMNDRDAIHIGMAAAIEVPADGVVARIVDLGCSIGQLTVALKERFPDADIWGLDVAPPMLRYAHQRAAGMGVAVHFAQRLAEDSGLAAGSVDIVTANILFHEIPAAIAHRVCAEAFRILRPGGIFDITDFKLVRSGEHSPFMRYMRWADHVYNGEHWSEEYVESDFLQTLRDAGFTTAAQRSSPGPLTRFIAQKPAR